MAPALSRAVRISETRQDDITHLAFQRSVSSLLTLPLGFLFHKPDFSVQVDTNVQLFSLRGPVVHMLTVGQPLNRLTGKVKLPVCLGRGIESVQFPNDAFHQVAMYALFSWGFCRCWSSGARCDGNGMLLNWHLNLGRVTGVDLRVGGKILPRPVRFVVSGIPARVDGEWVGIGIGV